MPEVLSRMGYQPTSVRKGGEEYWYRSPLRKEKTPSFHTSYIRKDDIWVWKDFGDEGSNVLEFVMRHNGTRDVRAALQFLRNLFPGHSYKSMVTRDSNMHEQKPLFKSEEEGRAARDFNAQQNDDTRNLEFIRAVPIQKPVIFQYLEKVRKIPPSVFLPYLEEVHYYNKDKKKGFFAFGMKNNSGGYEARSASDDYIFKSALIKRDLTYVKGRAGDFSTLNLFEGMLDYLSLLVLLDTNVLNGDTIIMHSTSTFKPTAKWITEKNYGVVNTFLDNDKTGRKFTAKFQEAFGERIINQSGQFKPFDDLNEVLKSGANFGISKYPEYQPQIPHPETG